MSKLFSFLFFLFLTGFVLAQLGMDDWRVHISPNKGVEVVKSNSSVHCALKNGLQSYYLQNGEKTLRTSADYLSDVEITALGYAPNSDVVVIGYLNGNIDLLIGEQIVNLNAIQVANISGVKRINRIVAHEDLVYVATGFGIVVINIQRREVKDTYYPTAGNQPVLDIAFTNDSIYALTASRLYVGALSNNFLADEAQWKQASFLPDYSATGTYNCLESFNNKLYIGYNDEVYNGDSLFRWDNESLTVFKNEIELNNCSAQKDRLLVATEGAMYDFSVEEQEQERIFQYTHGSFPQPVSALYTDGLYYISDKESGFIKAVNSFSSERIAFEGPLHTNAYSVKWVNNKLIVGSGGLNSSDNPSFSNRGGYVFEEEKWVNINRFNQQVLTGAPIWDFVSCAVNPRNTAELVFGTYSEIPLIRSTDGVTIQDTFTFSNSALEPTSLGNGWGHISDIIYDRRDNLWVLNSLCAEPLKVLTADGEWISFSIGGGVANQKTTRLLIDNNNIKWFGVNGVGVVAFDDNGTLDDFSDDRYRVLNTSPTGGNLPNLSIEALAVDLDNNIWVGTPEGMRVLYNANNVFDADPGQYNFQRLLIEFGENVEIVLGTTHITSIEIDGGDRKWFGTANSGVFLFTPDGLTALKNYTEQNSPLLSNTIIDMAIDETTGEVFFATNEGLISYRSDASTGDPSYSNVKVFPNPVYPSYFGPITIQGIAANSDVRITDVSGKLVYKTVSNGGTATWDGRTLDGQRAVTGVYLIWTTIDNENEKGRKVGKVVFIN